MKISRILLFIWFTSLLASFAGAEDRIPFPQMPEKLRVETPQLQSTKSIVQFPVLPEGSPMMASIPKNPSLMPFPNTPSGYFDFCFTEFTGGVNKTTGLGKLSPNQALLAENFLPDSTGAMVKRDGLTKVNSTAAGGVYGLGTMGDDIIIMDTLWAKKADSSGSYVFTKLTYSQGTAGRSDGWADGIWRCADAHFWRYLNDGDGVTIGSHYTITKILDNRHIYTTAPHSGDSSGIAYTTYKTNTKNTATNIYSFADKAIFSNGADDPFIYDGQYPQKIGIVWEGSITADSICYDNNHQYFHDTTLGMTADDWIGYWIQFTDSCDVAGCLGTFREIVDNGTDWFKTQQVGSGTFRTYQIVSAPDISSDVDSGDVTSSDSLHLGDTGQGWTTGVFNVGTDMDTGWYARGLYYVEITEGTGKGQVRHIVKASATNVLQIEPRWEINPTTLSDYKIWEYSMPRGKTWIYYKNSLFGHGGGKYKNRVYFSETDDINDFPLGNYLDATSDVNALKVIGDYVFVFQDHRIERIAGTSPASFYIYTFIEGVGCPAPKSIAVHGKDIWFLSWDGIYTTSAKGLYYESGYQMNRVSDLIQTEIVNANKATIKDWAGAYYDDKYWLSDGTNTWVYDTKTQGWWKLTNFGFTDFKVFSYPNDTLGLVGAKSASGYLLQYAGVTDTTVAITATYESPWIDFGSPTNQKILRKFWALFRIDGDNSDRSDTMGVYFYVNDDGSTLKDSLKYGRGGTKRTYDLLSPIVAGKCFKIKMYSDADTLRIYTYGIEGIDRGMRQ